MASMDSLQALIANRREKQVVENRRSKFKTDIVPLFVSDVSTTSKAKNVKFVTKSLMNKNTRLSSDEIEKRYFRAYSSSQINFLYPTLELKNDSSYTMNVQVSKARDFTLHLGGHLSSRPVNTAYFGISYQTMGNINTKTKL